MTVTPEQAQMLTTLAQAIRPHGAPHWDAPGVMVAIKRVAHMDLADVTRAVTRAAEDRTLITPAVIGTPSAPCWRDRTTTSPPRREPYDAGTFCAVCSEPRDRCERRWADDHAFEPAAHARRRKGTLERAPVVVELKGHLEPLRTPPPSPTTRATAHDQEEQHG